MANALYEIMWENMTESENPQIIWRMHFTCWLRKSTETHSHGNSGYANGSECYTIRISPLILVLQNACLIRKTVV